MAKTSTLTRLVSAGSGTLIVNTKALDVNTVSFQISGDGAVNGAVTVKLQESNTSGGTFKDITGTTATVNVNTDEYFDGGTINSRFVQFDVSVGAATLGTITIVINYK